MLRTDSAQMARALTDGANMRILLQESSTANGYATLSTGQAARQAAGLADRYLFKIHDLFLKQYARVV